MNTFEKTPGGGLIYKLKHRMTQYCSSKKRSLDPLVALYCQFIACQYWSGRGEPPFSTVVLI